MMDSSNVLVQCYDAAIATQLGLVLRPMIPKKQMFGCFVWQSIVSCKMFDSNPTKSYEFWIFNEPVLAAQLPFFVPLEIHFWPSSNPAQCDPNDWFWWNQSLVLVIDVTIQLAIGVEIHLANDVAALLVIRVVIVVVVHVMSRDFQPGCAVDDRNVPFWPVTHFRVHFPCACAEPVPMVQRTMVAVHWWLRQHLSRLHVVVEHSCDHLEQLAVEPDAKYLRHALLLVNCCLASERSHSESNSHSCSVFNRKCCVSM